MIGIAMLGSNDVHRAQAFYDGLMPLLGGARHDAWSTANRVWYVFGPNAPMLAITKPHDGHPATVGNGSMVALVAPSREAVGTIHAKALSLGGTDEGGPGHRSDHKDDLYRADFRDLDGNKLMVFAKPAA